MNDNNKITVFIDPDLQDLIPGFLENRSRDIGKLQTALEQSDLDTLKSIGHNLKGVGGGYGFQEISQLGAEIESSAKNGSIENISVFIIKFKDYLNNLEVKFQ